MTITVGSGQTSTVSSNLSGVSNYSVLSGGVVNVLSGGFTSGDVLQGGAETVSSSGGALGAAVSSGGALTVSAGGVASGAFVSSDGVEIVSSGGSAANTTLLSGGTLIVQSGGSGGASRISAGGLEIVSSGGIPGASITLLSGGTLEVFNSGITLPTVWSAGGILEVGSGAADFVGRNVSPVISSGRILIVESGATDTARILSGGLDILAGKAGDTLSGGTLEVLGGAVLANVTVFGGSVLEIGSGFTQSGLAGITSLGIFQETVLSGGTLIISGGSTVENVIVSAGGSLTVLTAAESTIVDAGGSETISGVSGGGGQEAIYGTLTVVGGGSADDDGVFGTATISSGGSTLGTTILNGGAVTVSSGGTVTNTDVLGTLEVQSGGTADFTQVFGGVLDIKPGGIVAGEIVFGGGENPLGGVLQIDGTGLPADPTQLISATIGGFFSECTIDLPGIAFSNAGAVNLVAGNELQISEDGTTYDIQLDPTQNFTGDFFHLADDGNGGSMITEDTTPCFCRGTLIRTPDGNRPVETLRIGDLVITLSGEALPLKWIGRRSYRDWTAVGNEDVQPILFKAGSIADGIPSRDLCVSPEHAMFIDGVLVPARHLVNGASILKVEGMEEIDYFHLEFDRHVVILAEGAAAESFVDDDSRVLFHNAEEYRRLYPDERRGRFTEFCAPRVEAGAVLETLHHTLAIRAMRLQPDGTAAEAHARLGYLDRATRTVVEGWAFGMGEGPVRLAILINGAVIGRTVADRYRAGLGFGDGHCSFRFDLPNGLSADDSHRIEVRRESDWTLLSGAPIMLAAIIPKPL